MDDYAEWFVWTASLDLAVPDIPDNARIRRSIGADKARRVLIALAVHADAAGYAWPSIHTMMDRTGLERWAVTDGLAYLIAAGVIAKAGKVGRTVRYRLIKGRGTPDPSPHDASVGEPPTLRHKAPQREPSGEPSGKGSGQPSGNARPKQEQEHNLPPAPRRSVPSDLVAAMEGEGIRGDAAIQSVVDIAAGDPETINPVSRLTSVPVYRRKCIEVYRVQQDRAATERWEAAEKCGDCGQPIDVCDRVNAKARPADRCRRLRVGGAA